MDCKKRKTEDEKIKNYRPVKVNTEGSCWFPFLSPIIHPIQRYCVCPLPKVDQSDTTCEYRPLLAFGLFWLSILRRVWIPISSGIGVVYAAKKEPCDPTKHLVRACDLPLYADERQCAHCVQTRSDTDGCEKSLLEETISCARKELWFLMDQGRVVKGEVAEALRSAMDEANSGLEFLRKEDNLIPRMGAIGVGGLAGFVFGLRRGIIKRMFYSTVGAGAMAALCYPREAREYSKEAADLARKYTLISYHFLNGDEVDPEKLNSNSNHEDTTGNKKVCKCPPKVIS